MTRMRNPAIAGRIVPLDVHERERLERIVARARLVVALALLVSTRFDLPPVPRFTTLLDAILVGYGLYSVLVFLLVEFRPPAVVHRGMEVEGIDLFWAAVITTVTGGPSSHFSPPLFVFALLVAAFRWGFRQTAIVGIASVTILVVDALAALGGYLGVPLRLGDLIMRSAWLLLVTFILGYLAEWNRGLRAESALLARIGRHVRVQAGLGASVRTVLAEVKQAFGAAHALLVSEELSTGRTFVWSARGDPAAPESPGRPVEPDKSQRSGYVFQTPADADTWGALHGAARGNRPAPAMHGVDSGGRRVTSDFPVPDRVAGGLAWSSLMLTSTVVDDWRVRMLLVDPAADATSDSELRFLQTIGRQVGPALVNLYLVRRLRTKVEEVERGRVARELHDGLVQSLIGLEFEMEVARQRIGQAPSETAATIERLQQMVREQVADVRTLMRQLRPLRADGRTLHATLADIVAAFGRAGGVTATFVSEVDHVDLPPHVCREIARILGDALVNARTHGRASEVRVSLDALDGGCRLVVDDNGRGFDFTGRLSDDELADRPAEPAIPTERVRSIGGRLWVESTPGKGSRLDILIQRSENL